MTKLWKVAAFYHFAELPDCRVLAARIHALGVELGIRGTILFAEEGVNSTVAGSADGIDRLLAELRSHPKLGGLEAKFSESAIRPFPRFKVKVKREIVTFRQPGADPRAEVGDYVEPAEWNALISDPAVLTIDTRNDYEVRLGRFRGAANPNTGKFEEFAEYVRTELAEDKSRPIAMYCTGGIRCERATAFLKSEGFEKVFHLKGGILKYLEETPPEASLWEGDCFVFDYRVAVDHQLRPAPWGIDRETGDPIPLDPAAEARRHAALAETPLASPK